MEDLSIRMTHRYRSGWAGLDDWKSVGQFEIEARGKAEEDEEDMCEGRSQPLFVRVEKARKVTDDTIRRALQSQFSYSHCQHEYDCCGCRSYHAFDVRKLGKGYWLVVQTSSRNY